MLPKITKRTCVFCRRTFEQDFLKMLQCICPDCRRKTVRPETIDEHIEEERKKSPEFKKAFDEERKKLEGKEENCDNK